MNFKALKFVKTICVFLLLNLPRKHTDYGHVFYMGEYNNNNNNNLDIFFYNYNKDSRD